jgi:hypothetical protein
MTNSTPDQLPLLGAGAHLSPSQGACLMEYVSVLAGEVFSDHPRCTDPVLAHLARLVNDATSDDGRPRLVRFAPDLAAAGRREPAAAPAVVAAALRVALALRPTSWTLRRHLSGADRRLQNVGGADPGLGQVLSDALYRSGFAPRALAAATGSLAAVPDAARDAALASLLDAALRAHRHAVETLPPRAGDRSKSRATPS